MNKYRCKHCKKVVKRNSNKQWIRSYCDKTEKFVRLILVKGKIIKTNKEIPCKK